MLSLAVAGAACVGSENFETRYQSLSDARKHGIVGTDRLLPEILPGATTEIYVLHNADVGNCWACFRPNGQSDQVVSLLLGLGARPTKDPVAEVPVGLLFTEVDWWPTSMTQEGGEVYEFKSSAGATTRVGIDRLNDRVCLRRRR